MNSEYVLKILQKCEGLMVEFKWSENELLKNPDLAKFFVQNDRAEELETGMRKIFKYCQLYSDSLPVVDEGDIFEAKIPLKNITNEDDFTDKGHFTDNFTDDFPDENLRLKQIIIEIKKNNKVSTAELGKILKVTKRTIASDIAYLKGKNILERSGNNKTGCWKLTEKT